jgi:glycosyltransferase involved in cell wall biosynthesis
MNAPAPNRVAFVVKGYPRLSETFIAQEILALEQRGLDILIVSLRHPIDRTSHPVHGQIRAPVVYLPEYLRDEPKRVWHGWRQARRLPGYRAARRAWRRDLLRDPSPNRIRRFGQALVLAAELPADIRQLHAHFLHTPASVARYAALLRGIDWSVSAHAKDLWTIPAWEKREKLADARWAVTCTAAGHQHLADLAPAADRVLLSYHGLDLDRFPPAPPRPPGGSGNGNDTRHPVAILSVGRAVEKKGYDDLLSALALLPPALAWRLRHIGGGALAERLKRRAARLGLNPLIEWRGAQPQPEVLAAYRQADLFVLAAKVAKDGDRDGLPNVLLEAQSQGLPCIATELPGIAELIDNGRTGVLVPPGNPKALAAAIEGLIRAPALRAQIGAAGETRVRRDFDMRAGLAVLAARFGLPAEPEASVPVAEAPVEAEVEVEPAQPAPPIAAEIPPAPAAARWGMALAAGAAEVLPTSAAAMPEPAVEAAAIEATAAAVETGLVETHRRRPPRMGAAIALRSHLSRQG